RANQFVPDMYGSPRVTSSPLLCILRTHVSGVAAMGTVTVPRATNFMPSTFWLGATTCAGELIVMLAMMHSPKELLVRRQGFDHNGGKRRLATKDVQPQPRTRLDRFDVSRCGRQVLQFVCLLLQ